MKNLGPGPARVHAPGDPPDLRPGATHTHRYGVDVRRLISAGLLKAGDTLVAAHRGTEHQAIVLDDGRIKLAGGEPFTSLSGAAAYARGTQSANGWEFWQLQTRRERRPLRELRDKLIRGER